MSDEQKPLDPEAARVVARVRRLMLIATTTTFVAVAIVLMVIGYRLFNVKGSGPAEEATFAEVSEALPTGAKVLSTAIGADHIVVTIEVGGAVELRTYDPDTLKPQGRLRLEAGR